MKLCIPSRCKAKLPENIEDKQYIAEEKLDGSRFVLYIGGCPYGRRTGNTLLSRRESVSDGFLSDKTDNVPHITDVDYKDLNGTVLDGEVFYSSFLETNAIMNSLPEEAVQKQKTGKVVYNAFDVMFYSGLDVRALPWVERRAILETVVSQANSPYIKAIKVITDDKLEYFKQMIAQGGEGLIIKDTSKPYGEGWSKLKKSYDISAIITGYKPGKGKYANQLGSIAVSVYHEGNLVEIGYVSGFNDQTRLLMSRDFDAYKGKVIDVFAQEIQKVSDKNLAGRLRHPTFHRFRDDVKPEDCTSEKMFSDYVRIDRKKL